MRTLEAFREASRRTKLDIFVTQLYLSLALESEVRCFTGGFSLAQILIFKTSLVEVKIR